MFRNQYDTDVTTFSPQGRLHQIEYAQEAVKQGSAVVGVRNKNYAVLATLKRTTSDLASTQKKLFKIDDHVGMAIAGLTADARLLSKYMRTECLNYKYVYECAMPLSRLVLRVADKHQIATQRVSKRPFGVGLLIIGYDQQGPHLYETSPSGEYWEYRAMSIGARAQSARTYLEKLFETLDSCSLDQLCRHAILALRETVTALKDIDLSTKNCALAIVGKDMDFTVYEDEDILPYLDVIQTVRSQEMDGQSSTPL
ncbi:hypothetical protein GpartN1_g4317.t1 [Galdieria partita]|uniref:Proteasome subunit alpha type n=1 Tax=Galdieria partita TaxID=83374 RepID=A0A9C7PZ28_9RHOD|nr:hypothetical protein GpartN1_g4317.t1 [Galdieria partita]